jgi:hypothetical protein
MYKVYGDMEQEIIIIVIGIVMNHKLKVMEHY